MIRKKRLDPKNRTVTNYWLDYYCEDHCTLCGNSGFVDTRGAKTSAGLTVGRINYCICPNGQTLRSYKASLELSLSQKRL